MTFLYIILGVLLLWLLPALLMSIVVGVAFGGGFWENLFLTARWPYRVWTSLKKRW